MEENYNDILQPIYTVFVDKLIRFLVKNYKLANYAVAECAFFTVEIGEAVITISNIFQREYRKTFYYLRKSLKYPGRLEEYCMLITVKKDDCYFFNFLRRISIIFELAKYCFLYINNGNEDYFGTAFKCIKYYPDLVYFIKKGGWESLKHIASFFTKIGRPLKLILKDDFLKDESIQSFPDAVRKLREYYLFSANTDMLDSKEMICLEALGKAFEANSASTVKKARCSPLDLSPDSEGGWKSEKDLLMDYWERCVTFEDDEFVCPGHSSKPEVKKMHLRKQLSQVLYSATVLMKEISHIGESGRESQEDTHQMSEDIHSSPSASAGGNVQGVGKSLTTPFQQIVGSGSPKIHERLKTTGVPEEASDDKTTEREFCSPKRLAGSKCPATSRTLSPKSTVAIGKECEAGPSSRKTDTLQREPGESSGSLEVSETVGDDIKYSFIVPEKYFYTNIPGENSDACKYLYSMKINPPWKKERMTKPLKEMLDTNFKNKNYRLMSSGDYFVSPPGSYQDETRMLLVDSSTDEEGDGYTDRLICLSKKLDLERDRKEGIYELRARRPTIQRTGNPKREPKTAESKSPEAAEQKQGRKSKHRAALDRPDNAAHVKHVTKLYKRHLPLILKTEENYVSYLSTSTRDPTCFSADCSNCMKKKSTVFLLDAALLAKRKVELEEKNKCKHVLALLESTEPLAHVIARILPSQQNKKLNSCIKRNKYSQISDGVYLVGEFALETRIWYLFARKRHGANQEEFNRATLRVAELYKKAVNTFEEFSTVSKDFITRVIYTLRFTLQLNA